jgi:rhamnogalacturonyl hydrolase YesR
MGCLAESLDPAGTGEPVHAAGWLLEHPDLSEASERMQAYLLNDAPRAEDGTLYHMNDRAEVWVDSLYMAPPFLAITGHAAEAVRQINGIRKRLWNAETKLYSPIWDEAAGGLKRSEFWGVGNGWAAAGIMRVINALKDDMVKERLELTSHVQELLDGCIVHQHPDGLFHYIVDDPTTFVETNLAQMLAYTIYTGVKRTHLGTAYLPSADRMREAAHAKVDEYGLVRGVCGAPTFDHPGISPEGQAFFLLMEASYHFLINGDTYYDEE